jgi:predicted nuclease with TOPRIM domain
MGTPAAGQTNGQQVNVTDLLDSTTRSFDDIQKKLEDRMARVGERSEIGAVQERINSEIGAVQERINQLHQKLASIETKIREYELEQ